MGKRVNEIGAQLILTPRTSFYGRAYSPEELRLAVIGFKTAIERARHSGLFDELDELSDASIDPVTEEVCAHCGGEWTEDGDDYNGGCCGADELAHEAAIATATE